MRSRGLPVVEFQRAVVPEVQQCTERVQTAPARRTAQRDVRDRVAPRAHREQPAEHAELGVERADERVAFTEEVEVEDRGFREGARPVRVLQREVLDELA